MKKTIALLCALVMAISLVPAISFAANEEMGVGGDANWYDISIHFVDIYDLNIELADVIEGTFEYGSEVEFEYPVIEGYTHEAQGTMGTYLVTGAADIYIKYIPDTHTVTVVYQFVDGTEAAPTVFEEVLYGRPYHFDSPVIEHYTADIEVVEGTMGTEDVEVIVTYVGEPCTVTIHLVDENGEPIGDDIILEVPYGTDFEFPAPEMEGYTPDVPGVGGVIEGDTEFTIPYSEIFEPVPPTVEGTRAELRMRPTVDSYRDLRFIFTVNFNDSYVVYRDNVYGNTEDYYVIDEFYSILTNEQKEIRIDGVNIFTMYEDQDGNRDTNIYTYTAVLRGVRPVNFDDVVTAEPFIVYTWETTVTDNGTTLTSCVDDLLNN